MFLKKENSRRKCSYQWFIIDYVHIAIRNMTDNKIFIIKMDVIVQKSC